MDGWSPWCYPAALTNSPHIVLRETQKVIGRKEQMPATKGAPGTSARLEEAAEFEL